MEDAKYNEPRLALNRIYTRMGDAGQTSLAGGQRVSKSDPRIEAYGTVDELNAVLGIVAVTAAGLVAGEPRVALLAAILRRVQHELFNLGAILATRPENVHPKQARISAADVRQLEQEMDAMNQELSTLRSFVLPGGSRLNAELHLARTVCRRAERVTVALGGSEELPEHALEYLNRLSDAFFVWSRWANHVLGVPEVLWSPNESAGAQRT